MSRLKLGMRVGLPLLLFMAAGAVNAATLHVNCGGKAGLTSIGGALKELQYSESHGPNTINVSGACHENVVIQSVDRLTLNAVNHASVSDASGGKQDVIAVFDSRDVAINGFTINAGSDGVTTTNGISCNDWSACRLALNVIQGAGSGGGFAVYQASEATVDGDTFQNNGVGLIVHSGTRVRPGGQSRPIISRTNGQGIHVVREAFVFLLATVDNNSAQGVIVGFHSTLDLTGSISHNGDVGADVRESSAARFLSSTITNNGGPGVVVEDLSMATFGGSTVTGNGGGTDVVCAPQFSATRGALTDIGGGVTNCAEP
jgi:hypothetical protein